MNAVCIIVATLALAIAAMWAFVGVAGLIGRLPGNRWVGVRTAETGKTPEAWTLAHKVAAPGYLFGALLAALGGIIAVATGGWGLAYALGGLLLGALAVAVVSGVAVRAAQGLPGPDTGCSSGCCSGDDAPASEADLCGEPSAECGESSCGSCSLSSMCLPQTSDH